MRKRSQPRSGMVVEFPSGRPLRPQEPGQPSGHAPRAGRRLADRILVAFHLACDQGELEIAEALLRCGELAVTLGRGRCDRRADDERLIAAFERLWFLRHPEEAEHGAQPNRAGTPEG